MTFIGSIKVDTSVFEFVKAGTMIPAVISQDMIGDFVLFLPLPNMNESTQEIGSGKRGVLPIRFEKKNIISYDNDCRNFSLSSFQY